MRCKFCGREVETMELRNGDYVTIDKIPCRFDESESGAEIATYHGYLMTGIPCTRGKRMGNVLHRSSCKGFRQDVRRMNAIKNGLAKKQQLAEKKARQLEERFRIMWAKNRQITFL